LLVALAGVALGIILLQQLCNVMFTPGRGRLVEAWRHAYGSGTELLTSSALALVSLLAVFCFESLGFRGVLLCVMPLLFVGERPTRIDAGVSHVPLA
jgi:hypothetical protein